MPQGSPLWSASSHSECTFLSRKLPSLLLPTTPPSVSSRRSSSVSLSKKAVGRTEIDCAGGFGVQRSPLLISSPPECLSLLAKSMPISFRPHLSISPRFSSSVCLSGAIGRIFSQRSDSSVRGEQIGVGLVDLAEVVPPVAERRWLCANVREVGVSRVVVIQKVVEEYP